MTTKPNAKIICDSVAPNGVRLTTFICQFHRYVLAEVNTHRDFSRNSASSRAIPSAKMIERVENDIAMPVHYGSNQPGMQAGEQLDAAVLLFVKAEWLEARTDAVEHVRTLLEHGLHKQVANRLLEPFNWHTAIITTTKLDNFFWQRCHPDAQPEFKALADSMQYAYYMGDPKPLKVGQWHLPFADDDETVIELSSYYRHQGGSGSGLSEDDFIKERQKALSVARCARVSYLNHDGSREVTKDFDLYDKLIAGMHMSPGEHQGTPCEHVDIINNAQSVLCAYDSYETLQVSCKLQGNFSTGWHQLRKLWKNENRSNFIPNLPELADIAERIKAGEKLW